MQPSRLKASGRFEVVTRTVVSDDEGKGRKGRRGGKGGGLLCLTTLTEPDDHGKTYSDF